MNTYKTIDKAIAAIEYTFSKRYKTDSISIDKLYKAIKDIKTNSIAKFNNTIYIVDEYDILA